MNKMILTMTAKPGHAQEVGAGVKSLVEYVKNKHDIQSEVYMQILGGSAGTFFVIGEYKDAAGAQAAQAKLMVDKEYWALAQKFAELIIDPPTIRLLQKV